MFDAVFPVVLQEKRRAERAEQQRVRAEKEKERQARREVRGFHSLTSVPPKPKEYYEPL